MNKIEKILVTVLIVLVIILVSYIVNIHNIFLSTLYNEQYRLETSEKTEILESFHKVYPNSTIRYSPTEQIPVIIYEVQNNDKKIMLTGTFYTENPIFFFKCMEENTFTTIFSDVVTEPTYFENRFCQ